MFVGFVAASEACFYLVDSIMWPLNSATAIHVLAFLINTCISFHNYEIMKYALCQSEHERCNSRVVHTYVHGTHCNSETDAETQTDGQTAKRLEWSHNTPSPIPPLVMEIKAATQHAMLSVYRLWCHVYLCYSNIAVRHLEHLMAIYCTLITGFGHRWFRCHTNHCCLDLRKTTFVEEYHCLSCQ